MRIFIKTKTICGGKMRKRVRVLALSLAVFLSGGMAFGYTNTTNYKEISMPACNETNTKICVADELMKEMLKETIYAVGTKVLNKYINTPSTPKTTTTTTTPATTTTTTTAPAQSTTQEEQMIIVQ
jgi:hypothetical protein